MKSLLESTLSLFGRKLKAPIPVAETFTDSVVDDIVESVTTKHEAPVEIVETMQIKAEPVKLELLAPVEALVVEAPAALSIPVSPLEPEPAPQIEVHAAVIKTVQRGSALYGVCPHCEGMWNVNERLIRLHTSGKPLSCPTCNALVALPEQAALSKLS